MSIVVRTVQILISLLEWTNPLFVAVQNGHIQQVQLFLTSGANVNATDKVSICTGIS